MANSSSRGEAKDTALLSSRDGYIFELTVWPKMSQASCGVWRDVVLAADSPRAVGGGLVLERTSGSVSPKLCGPKQAPEPGWLLTWSLKQILLGLSSSLAFLLSALASSPVE